MFIPISTTLEYLSMRLGPLEKRVLEKIWEKGEEITVKDVWESFKERYAYTTILTIFQNLEKKGLISGRLKGKVKFYKARITKEEYYKEKLANYLRGIIEEYPEAARTFFLETMNLDEYEVERILNKLRELEK